jgi:hypothetical protein
MTAGIVLVGFVLACYFIPTFVAAHRKKSPLQVFAVNLLFGWTFLGWCIALIMALGTPRQPTVVYVNSTQAAAK